MADTLNLIGNRRSKKLTWHHTERIHGWLFKVCVATKYFPKVARAKIFFAFFCSNIMSYVWCRGCVLVRRARRLHVCRLTTGIHFGWQKTKTNRPSELPLDTILDRCSLRVLLETWCTRFINKFVLFCFSAVTPQLCCAAQAMSRPSSF